MTADGLTLWLSATPRCLAAGGRSVDLAAPDALMLAWLAIEGPTPRERLASLLWPNSSADAARNALRQRLFRLRRQCGRELVGSGAMLALAAGERHDLDAGSGLLGALDAPDSPEIAAWLHAQRQRRDADSRRTLEARIDALESDGELAAALALAQELLAGDGLSEDAHRRVMRLHYLRGDRAAALLAFDRLEQRLKHEVGARPSAASLELLRTVEIDGPAPLARRQAEVPASVLRPPRLVGRDRELDRLRRGWLAGQVMVVSGEAGMGKSRLLQALADGAAARLIVSARPGDSVVPYASLSRVLHQVVARCPEALTPALQGPLGPLLPGLAEPAASPPRRSSLVAPVQALLRQARPGLDGLVLDDLHFADDASIELLQALLAAPRSDDPMRWCLGLRPPQPGSRLADFVDALASALPLEPIEVSPLEVAQIAELVDSLGLPGVSGAAIAPALRQRSGGNPLFALETLKLAWVDGGPDLGGELPRPQSLAQLIGQQLARLSAGALQLARVAAVAGADFSLPLAEKVLATAALQLADSWHELEAQHVLVGTEFAHDLVFEAVLGGIPAVIARHLHGQLAAWIESNGGEPARVAAHWEAAGERERALPWLRAAADRAHRALRERERIDFLLRAADIAESSGDADEAFQCVTQAVETHMNSIRQADGFPLLDRLDRLAHEPLQRARSLGLRAWYCSQLADEHQAVAVGEQALALAAPLGDATLLAQIRQRLATALAMLARFDAALPHLQAVQPWADAHLAPEDLAEFHGNFAVVLDNLGHPEQALPHHRQAIDAAQQAGDHAQRATHLANQAVNRLNAGDVNQAAALVSQAQHLMRSFDLQGSSVGFMSVLQVQCARAAGRYREALAAADEAQAVLEATLPARVPVVHLHRGHCWLDLGQHARALQELRQAARALPPHIEARRLVLLARLQRLLGLDPLPLLDEAEAAAPRSGWPELRMTVAAERACGLPANEASALLETTLGAARRYGLRGSVLALLLRLAERARECDPARAAAAAREALGLAPDVEPSLLYRGELWLACAGAIEAAGDAVSARAVRNEGRLWVQQVADRQVDASFRESFLQRNPVNRMLFAGGPA